MGHSITAYRQKLFEDEVAYLRRNAADPLRHMIYGALQVIEFDADVSGGGLEAKFTMTDLECARNYLADQNNHETLSAIQNDTSMITGLMSAIADAAGADKIIINHDPSVPGDLYRELGFIEKCIAHLEVSGEETVVVYFS
jgi:hypothetical protein